MRLVACLVFPLAAVAAADFRAGAAQVDITPPPGAPMAGYYYNRAAAGVHDPLQAKAIVIEKDGITAALVACDLASLPRSIAEDARRRISETLRIPGTHVMISATHTHTGPVLLAGTTRYNVEGEMKRIGLEYAGSLGEKIAESVRLAHASLRPARVMAAQGREDSLTFNRRFHMKDGHVAWNPRKQDPNIERPAGPIDGSVPVVYFEAADGKPIAVYVNYALHLDTVGGQEYSADYAYTLSQILGAAKGKDFVTLFTIGCAGNLNHRDVSTKDPQKGHGEAARIGATLAAEVLKTLKRAPLTDVASIRASTEMLQLPLPEVRPNDIDWARTTAATFDKPNAAPFMDLVKAFKIIEVVERKGKPMEAEVQIISFGRNLAFAALPGEIFVEHGLAIRQASPFPHTIIAELANGSVGYVPDRKAFPQGAYEVVSARTGEGSGEMMVDSATRQLIRLFHGQ
jgi:hypothetical protein